MGYRGKLAEQARARDLRAAGWTYAEICTELGVSRSSVSLWVRDVDVDPVLLDGRRRERYLRGNLAATKRPSRLHLDKLEEIERCAAEASSWLGALSDRDLLIAGIALYAGEGSKTAGGGIGFANSDPRMVGLFVRWLRRYFEIDERRLRVRLYLHEGLDLAAATHYWSTVTAVPAGQFQRPYRAVPDRSIRGAKHPMGCATVRYFDARHHRTVLGLTDALLASPPDPG